VNESSLGVHQIEFVIESGKSLCDGSGVVQHADCTLDFSQVTARNYGGRLVVDANLEASGAPIDELNGPLGFNGGDGSVDILGNNVSTIQQTTRHVLAVTRIAFHHLIGGFEARVGDICYSQRLVIGFLRRNDGGVCRQRKVNTRIRHQIGLEFREIDVKRAVESQRRRNGRADLSQQTIQVRVSRTLDVQVTSADVVEGLVIDEEGDVTMLQSGVSTK